MESEYDVYDYLELAYSASSKKKCKEYLNKALELDPDNIDVLHQLIIVDAKNEYSLLAPLSELLAKATSQMEKEGYFEQYKGVFWDIHETRPYMRLRFHHIRTLVECRRMRLAAKECEEMLELCTSDNLGVRYTLMFLYAWFEDEKKALTLYEQYNDFDMTSLLLPLCMLYYKLGDDENARLYLKKLEKCNKDTKVFFSNSAKNDSVIEEAMDEMMPFAYAPNTIQEYLMIMQDYDFIMLNTPQFFFWANEQLKRKKAAPAKN
ncbi:MAG: hypothetical protein IKZ82_00975 [Clostridia bacterium]|nr:hypothetical protein [Clostridia bacterium]